MAGVVLYVINAWDALARDWSGRRGPARGGTMRGARMDHAMASDTERPARAREDRPAAGSSVDTPRE